MPHLPASALLDAALAAAERGWHVFPLRPHSKVPALHGEAHCPRIRDCAAGHVKWEQRASTDPRRIHRAWADAPFNVAIATGPSHLVVVDLDVSKEEGQEGAPDGATSLAALCERAGEPIPQTYTVRTASGGQHLYFTALDDVRLTNSTGRLGKAIDTRAHGGYVVAAHSIVGGTRYTVDNPTPPAPLPAWLLHALLPPVGPRPAAPVVQARTTSAYVRAALRNEVDNVTHAREGGRNVTLRRAARALGRLVASGDLSRDEVERPLHAAGAAAGLPPREVAATVTSALNWSLANNPARSLA
ncbi:bifunctional DNA primase/polymerase [Streptomyces sp. NPDC058657]|uniref:bifunctional DNA primase/polymerase n=1 Tax=unclassified Streptomyces TaxID=2593676 RepID=UPI00366003C7